MHQANALKLQQGVRERETTLEQCYLRMEQGQAPSDEIHFEWKKIEVVEHRKQKEMEMRREVKKEEDIYLNFLRRVLFFIERGRSGTIRDFGRSLHDGRTASECVSARRRRRIALAKAVRSASSVQTLRTWCKHASHTKTRSTTARNLNFTLL